MQLDGQKIVVVGLARSGLAVGRFLRQRGARVTITDRSGSQGLGAIVDEACRLGLELELGGHRVDTFLAANLIVISPGVPHTLEPLLRAGEKGIPIIGEVELAARHIQAPLVAVSGTNGKTTTTELLGRMLAASGLQVYVGGNIGNPLIDIAGRDAELDVIVAEISSFQLDTTRAFRPHVGVLLNISPDHLDRYPGIEAYAGSKGLLFRNQTADDYAVCHGTDPLVQAQAAAVRSRRLDFFPGVPGPAWSGQGAVIHRERIDIHVDGMAEGRVSLASTVLIGPHNRENIAAAALAALAAGGSLEGIQKAVDGFESLAHRIEPVGEVRGVRFINDSKATNVDAVVRALECFDHPVVLIMGGRNKGYDFAPLFPHVRRRVKKLIVIGEAGADILDALGAAPSQGAEKAPDMSAAVRQAFSAADPGDVVLLSPACASFDAFANYAQRGDAFKKAVGELL